LIAWTSEDAPSTDKLSWIGKILTELLVEIQAGGAFQSIAGLYGCFDTTMNTHLWMHNPHVILKLSKSETSNSPTLKAA